MTTFEKAVAAQGAESLLIEGGYFGIPKAETALDRGLADVNAALRKECAELKRINATLKAQVGELETVLERVSYPITMYRANRP
ncbi:MAG: hypothetical protein IPM03_02345 [Sulfuritalea sp.]|nr:hypothetical protein [Sulfuritalea sp.]